MLNRRTCGTNAFLALLLAFLLVPPVWGQPAVATGYEATVAEARALVEAHIREHNLPGMAVAVAVAGETVWSEGFGFADLEHRTPIWPTTKFRIGSVSKPITAPAVAQLYAAGRLDVDAPVQRYVPSFPEKEHPITTRQLGAHLAGIRHYRGDEFLSSRYYATVTEGLEIFKDDPLLHPPGSRYAYSSYGWNLISAVVEAASGEAFLAYMTARVFRPLGMYNTVPDQNADLIPQRVHFYEHDADGTLKNAPYVDNSYKWAGGGFLSTTEDLLLFAHAHMGDTFLPENARALLFTEQHNTAGEGVNYGFGWRVSEDPEGRPLLGHTGGSVGGTSVLTIQPDAGVVVVALVNLSDANLSVGAAIRNLFVAAAEERGR
jgi:CubicO group peptidase (beta-lactamase class C family)